MAVLDRHTKPEYKRWQKLLKGLYIVKDVLSPHAQQVLDDFHANSLIANLGAFCCVVPTLQLVLDKTTNKWKITGARACTGNKRCPDWLDTIAAEHLQGNRKDLFKSCDLTQLSVSSWEVGKTFLTPVQASGTNGPAELDPYYLMKMITQCRLFSQPPYDIHNAVHKVLKTRNELAHAAVQGINTDAEVTVKMDEMIDLVRLLPTVHSSIIGDLEKVRDGHIDEISKELTPREVDIFRLFLQDAQQGSSEQLDRLEKKVVKGGTKVTHEVQAVGKKVEEGGAKVTREVQAVRQQVEEGSAKVTCEVQAVRQKVEESDANVTHVVQAVRQQMEEGSAKVTREVQAARQQVEEGSTKVTSEVQGVRKKVEDESTKIISRMEEESTRVIQAVGQKVEEVLQNVAKTRQPYYKRPVPPSDYSRKDDTLARLQAELAETYLQRYSKLQPVPWSTEVSLPINLVYQEQTVTERKGAKRQQGSSSNLKSIFETMVKEQSRPGRILIEGPPGMGKSTLCQRLIQSWARMVNASPTEAASQRQTASHDDLEDSRLHDFQLVFLIRVRDLIAGDLTVNLQENLVHSYWKNEDLTERLKRCIYKNIEQVLLIVDGYDEGDEAQRTWVDSCLRGADCRGCTLIVTSRPGFCRPTAQPEQNPDRTYILMGLDRAKQQDFTSKFDQVMGVEPGQKSASEHLPQFQDQDFLQTPLLLALVCVLASQGDSSLPKTVSGLYNEFTEFLSSKAMRSPTNFKGDEVTKLLNFLQKIAFTLLSQKKSEISSDLLKEHISEKTMDNLCKLGLVQQEIKLKGWRNSQIGTFIHQSFLDFFAARHFLSVSKEERSALLEDMEIQGNTLVLAAGLCGESEEHHHECFGQMLEAWDQAVQRELEEERAMQRTLEKEEEGAVQRELEGGIFKGNIFGIPVSNHSVRDACFLWLSEFCDPCWLHAGHITAIYQTCNKENRGEGICLDSSSCTASCYRGVTTLLKAAEHHRLHGSHHALLDPATFKLTVYSRYTRTISPAAQIDLLDAAVRYNVQLNCDRLVFPDCLTHAQSDQLRAVLPRLTQLRYLRITGSSWTAVNVVLRAVNSTSQLQRLRVTCSPSSPPAATTAVDPWSLPDELLDNISRFSVLREIELIDEESTVETETRRAITRRFRNRLPGVRMRIWDTEWEIDSDDSDTSRQPTV